MNRFSRQLLGIANAGYKAYEAGKDRLSPYAANWRASNLQRQRHEHWLAGWDEACRANPKPIPRELAPERYLNPPGEFPRMP